MFGQKIILISCVIQAVLPHANSCGLDDFVRAGLTKYSAWIKSNNMDPSPLRDGPDEIPVPGGLANLQLEIRNHGIRGYSDGVLVGYVTANPPSHFDVGFKVLGNVTFHGQHQAFGTINNRPVSVQGSWFIRSSSISTAMFSLSFQELPTGYLNVTGQTLYDAWFSGPEIEIYFEGLSDNEAAVGSEEELKDVLLYGFRTYLISRDGWVSNHPFRRSYIQFWQDLLSQTKMEDIYGPASLPEFNVKIEK